MEPVKDTISRARLAGRTLGLGGPGQGRRGLRAACHGRGRETQSDEEHWLLEDGSRQSDLWGINLYPAEDPADWIEFDSMINVRPAQGNPGQGVEDRQIQAVIRSIVSELVR